LGFGEIAPTLVYWVTRRFRHPCPTLRGVDDKGTAPSGSPKAFIQMAVISRRKKLLLPSIPLGSADFCKSFDACPIPHYLRLPMYHRVPWCDLQATALTKDFFVVQVSFPNGIAHCSPHLGLSPSPSRSNEQSSRPYLDLDLAPIQFSLYLFDLRAVRHRSTSSRRRNVFLRHGLRCSVVRH